MRSVLLSVRPRFAEGLLSGRKTAEVRKRFPELPAGTRLYLYSSTPTRAVIGTVTVVSVLTTSPTRAWDLHRDKIDITRSFYRSYLTGQSTATIITVDQPEIWPEAVGLASLRAILSIEPPQSYRYLGSEQEKIMLGLGRAS